MDNRAGGTCALSKPPRDCSRIDQAFTPEYRAGSAQIAQMLITRCPPGDPFTHAGPSSRLLTYPEVLDVCRLIEDIDQTLLCTTQCFCLRMESLQGEKPESYLASNAAR